MLAKAGPAIGISAGITGLTSGNAYGQALGATALGFTGAAVAAGAVVGAAAGAVVGAAAGAVVGGAAGVAGEQAGRTSARSSKSDANSVSFFIIFPPFYFLR